MNSTPTGCDVFWEKDPLPYEPERPTEGSDLQYWRARSTAKLEEDAIDMAVRLRRPVAESEVA